MCENKRLISVLGLVKQVCGTTISQSNNSQSYFADAWKLDHLG